MQIPKTIYIGFFYIKTFFCHCRTHLRNKSKKVLQV